MTELFNENKEKASLVDVCNWWIEKYPADVFVFNPLEIVTVRNAMKIILNKINKKKC
jgi:hypothetical protein